MNMNEITQLKELPIKMKEKRLYLQDVLIHIEENRLIKKTTEQSIIKEIRNTTQEGKPMFTSEVKIKNELEERKQQNDFYQKLIQTEKTLKEAQAKEEIELSFLKETFRGLESLSRL